MKGSRSLRPSLPLANDAGGGQAHGTFSRRLGGARRWAVFGSVAALAALLVGCTGQEDATADGLFVVQPDGRGLRRLSPIVAEPAWAPDGTGVAFAGDDGVYLADVDGGEPVRVVEAVSPGVPAWSPDGQRIAFVDRLARQLVVHDLAAATAVRIPLIEPSGGDQPTPLPIRNKPSWSPDGRTVAFTSWDGAGDEIFVVDAAGGTPRQVSRTRLSAEPVDRQVPTGPRKAQSDAGFPAWSPDGTAIAYALYPETAGSFGGINLVAPDGTRQRRLVGLPARWGPVWSPDGVSILFVHRRVDRIDLYVVRADRRRLANLTPAAGPPVVAADWSPTGEAIAYAAGGDLHTVDVRGRVDRRLVASERIEAFPAWSPTGDLIAFTRSRDAILTPIE